MEEVKEILPNLLKNRDKTFIERLGAKNIECLERYERGNLNYSPFTRDMRLRALMNMAIEIGKPFEQMTREDIDNYFYRLSTDSKIKVKPYTKETKRAIVVIFFKWLYRMEDRYTKPEVVKGLKHNPKAYNKNIKSSDLLTDEEVKLMVDVCDKDRDKTLVMILYDTGCRINELLSANIGHVEFVGDAFYINLPQSKTEPRKIGLIHAIPHLKKYLENHPYRTDKDAPLFISFRGRRLGSDSSLYILKKLAKRAGIDKKINNHHFRHVSISNDRARGLADHYNRQKHGLRKGSNTIERYTWLDDEEAYDACREVNGLQPVNKKRRNKKVFDVIKCFCGTENPCDALFCYKCKTQLNYESVARDITILEMLKSNFAKFEGVDLDNMVKKYQMFKAETSDMQKVLGCFNGGNTVKIEAIHSNLELKDGDVIELLQYLVSADLITIDYDKVHLVERAKFEQFIAMQKRYLEVNQ